MKGGHWSYRLMRRTCHGVTQYNWYDVIKIYYDKNGMVRSWTEKGQGPNGETVEEAKSSYDMMAEAFVLPILDEAELPMVEITLVDITR